MSTSSKKTPQISVIIPTCRRPDDLRDVLESLAHQSLAGNNWEVLVVDNAPCAETHDVVESFISRVPQLSYIAEETPGLLAARHAGLRNARADLLLYGDDDIIASPDWVASVLQGFYRHGASIVGGSNLPLYESPPPAWLDSLWIQGNNVEMLYQYSVLKMGKDVPTPFPAWGCNFGIKKEALIQAGGFQPDGCPWNLVHSRATGEIAVVDAILDNGGKAILMPGATVQHKVGSSRLTLRYLWKRGVMEGVSISAGRLRAHGFQQKKFLCGSGAGAVYSHGFMVGFLFQRIAILEDPALVTWLLRDSYLGHEEILCQPADLPIPSESALHAVLNGEARAALPESVEDAMALAFSILPGQKKKAHLLAAYALLLGGYMDEGERMLNLAALDPACREPALFLALCFSGTEQPVPCFQSEALRLLAEQQIINMSHQKEEALTSQLLHQGIGTLESRFGQFVLQQSPVEFHGFAQACLEVLEQRLGEPLLDDNALDYYAYGSTSQQDADKRRIQKLVRRPKSECYINVYETLLREIATKGYLYSRLEDEQSRDLLVLLALYQVLGHVYVRLPYAKPGNRPFREMLWEQTASQGSDAALWKLLEDVSQDASGRYAFFDLQSLGSSLRLYSSDEEIFRHFFAPNYVYESPNFRVRPKDGDVLLDCGACLADTGLFFAEAVGPQGRVLLFEPMPKNQQLVQANLALNPHLAQRIQLVPAATGSAHGSTVEFADWGPSSHAGQAGKQGLPMVSVPVVSLDDVVKERALPRVDFIKMDIEGAELDTLRGAENILRQFRPSLAICLYHRPEDFATIPAYLDSLQLGYRFFLGHHYVNQFETVLYALADV